LPAERAASANLPARSDPRRPAGTDRRFGGAILDLEQVAHLAQALADLLLVVRAPLEFQRFAAVVEGAIELPQVLQGQLVFPYAAPRKRSAPARCAAWMACSPKRAASS